MLCVSYICVCMSVLIGRLSTSSKSSDAIYHVLNTQRGMLYYGKINKYLRKNVSNIELRHTFTHFYTHTLTPTHVYTHAYIHTQTHTHAHTHIRTCTARESWCKHRGKYIQIVSFISLHPISVFSHSSYRILCLYFGSLVCWELMQLWSTPFNTSECYDNIRIV